MAKKLVLKRKFLLINCQTEERPYSHPAQDIGVGKGICTDCD
jgi:hypothetical protein